MIFWKRSPYLFSSIYYTVEVDGHQNGLFTSILQNIIFHVLPTGLKLAMRVSKWWQDFHFWMSFFFNRECSPAFCACACVCVRTCVCVCVTARPDSGSRHSLCWLLMSVYWESGNSNNTCLSEWERKVSSLCSSLSLLCRRMHGHTATLGFIILLGDTVWKGEVSKMSWSVHHLTPSLAIHRVNIDSYLLFNSRLQVLLVGGILSFWHLNRQNW